MSDLITIDMRIYLWDEHHHPESRHIHRLQKFPWTPCHSSTLRLPAPCPQPRQPLAVFCHPTCVFSAVLHSGIIHFVFGLASLTRHHYFEIHPSYLVYQEFILFFNCWVLSSCLTSTIICLLIHLLTDFLLSCLPITDKIAMNIDTQVLHVDMGFLSFGVNTLEWNGWSIW